MHAFRIHYMLIHTNTFVMVYLYQSAPSSSSGLPPSLNMLRIQAGEQEKSEFFSSFWVQCNVSEQ